LSTTIELLAALQEIDQRLRQKEQSLEELRQQLASIAVTVETKVQEAQAQQQRITDLELRRRENERQLREEETKIKEKRVRQNRIRNDRELMAVRREIELMKEANGKLEEEGIHLLEQLDQERARLVQTETQVESLKANMAQETARVEAAIAALEAETQQERRERTSRAQSIDADLCARYERIFTKRGGVAVVELRADTCQGCYMRIPPQMSNQIRSSVQQHGGTIFHCPHCGRILYWRPVPEGASDA
jgi:predicted  nucleic acid-binding Zn-ribbon protein